MIKHTTRTRFGLGILACLVLLLVGVAVHRVRPQATNSTPQTVSTKPVGRDNTRGGQVIDGSHAAGSSDSRGSLGRRDGSPATAKPQPRAPAAIAPTRQSQSPTLAQIAPRQHELMRTVDTEHVYRALGQPNDPLQRPWVTSALRATDAWNQSTGAPVTVAIIDTGVALAHEDLVSQWWTNRGEIGTDADGNPKQSNGKDDDSNGYVDDWRGWDFIGNGISPDNDVQAGRTNPTGIAVSHGTSVAGLAGAATNNGIGVASINWQTRLMPLQVLDDSGEGLSSGVVSAIYYAVDNGAQVINMSLGTDYQDPAVSAAVEYAYSKGAVVVVAAGNCGDGCSDYLGNSLPPGTMSWPALDRHVIAVGATDVNDQRASFSSYGPGVDVSVPGSGTLASTSWNANNGTSLYAGELYGTSFASPIVASIAAYTLAQHPTATPDVILSLIDGTARQPSAMNGARYTSEFGHGIGDVAAAGRVGRSLATTNAGDITLAQAGSHLSEHTFINTSQLGSGCHAAVSVYCTIHAQDALTGFDRFLPYTLTGADGTAGWSWSGATLGTGEWWLRSRSGLGVSSSPYLLFQK